jgi:hypothetical protein
MRLSAFASAAAALVAGPAFAVTVQIGDVDSFGYDASDPALLNSDGVQVDVDGDGFIGVDEGLPSLNGDGTVSASSNDNIDNRSAAEIADPAAKWTDVTLSTSFGAGPGRLSDIAFVLTFDAPEPGDPDYVDHFFNVLGGDIGDPGGSILVDGVSQVLTSFQGEGLLDGGVTLTSVDVPLAALLDGELNIQFSGSDPYVMIDAMLLDTDQRAPETPQNAVPVPGAAGLLALGLGGIAALRRRRARA